MNSLSEVIRNRMLYQRESFWNAERNASREVLETLNADTGYITAMNVLANFMAMNILLWGNEADRITRQQVALALDSESSLLLWGDASASLDTLLTWLARGKKWRVEDASEFFRLFVAVIEKVNEKIESSHGLKMLKLQSTDYQFFKSVDKPRFSSAYQLVDLSIEDFKAINTAMGSVKARSLNNVDFFKKTLDDKNIDPARPRSRLTLPDIYQRIVSLNNDNVDSKRRIARMLANGSGGTNIHTLKPNSLVGTVEWIYGLASGADTSGTTAEIIALCQLFQDYLPAEEMDSLTSGVSWYLGPVLSMIKNGHHTLLESAVAITMGERTGDVGDYQWPVKYVPGVYSRLLMPPKPGFEDRPLYKKVLTNLSKYELQANDQVYIYQPTEGAWGANDQANVSLTGGTIINNYKYVARSGEQLMTYDLPAMLNDITAYLNTNAHSDALIVIIDKIYSLIRKGTKGEAL